jgi:hypothetical protein
MLESLGENASERKLRLFACACCRHIWDFLSECAVLSEEEHEVCRQAVARAERYADGHAAATELIELSDGPLWGYSAPAAFLASASKLLDVGEVLRSAAEASAYGQESRAYRASFPREEYPGPNDMEEWQTATEGGFERGYAAEEQAQCRLLRCIFGDSFGTVRISSTWRTSPIAGLAQATYEHRILPAGTLDNTRLAVLADALEEAGCAKPDILSHLRSTGPHVRGCWAVDLVLAKE